MSSSATIRFSQNIGFLKGTEYLIRPGVFVSLILHISGASVGDVVVLENMGYYTNGTQNNDQNAFFGDQRIITSHELVENQQTVLLGSNGLRIRYSVTCRRANAINGAKCTHYQLLARLVSNTGTVKTVARSNLFRCANFNTPDQEQQARIAAQQPIIHQIPPHRVNVGDSTNVKRAKLVI